MTTDFRSLCAELLDEIESGRAAIRDTVAAKLRAALAAAGPARRWGGG